ncbi:hypothetical protein, partial [Phascolarctobacterium succinatutens]|uniref:hypothetical protein n=1 Tax=Phascolarctobacterium succinatutens TaxID=626940 RepID=UPI0040274445
LHPVQSDLLCIPAGRVVLAPLSVAEGSAMNIFFPLPGRRVHISIERSDHTSFRGWFCGAIRFFLFGSHFFCFLLTMPRQWSRMVLQKRIAKEEF